MVVLHTSDLHGNWRLPMQFQDFDVWVDTGDFLPNVSRGERIEANFQKLWLTKSKLKLRKMVLPWLRERYGSEASYWYVKGSRQPPSSGNIAAELTAWLRGRPFISVQGNHDFTSLAEPLKRAGAKVWDVAWGPVEVGGEVFAGFREIPYVTGEWAGELEAGPMGEVAASELVRKALGEDPTILLTHSPAMGVLDFCKPKGGNCGIPSLSFALQTRPHRVKLHMFGHVHEQPLVVREGGIVFSNAATRARIIEVPG